MRTHRHRDTAAAAVRILLFWFASIREGVRARVCRLHAAWTPADSLDWTTYSMVLTNGQMDDMTAGITNSQYFVTSLPSQALRSLSELELSNQGFHLRKQTRRKHFTYQPGGSPLCATSPPLRFTVFAEEEDGPARNLVGPSYCLSFSDLILAHLAQPSFLSRQQHLVRDPPS